MALLSFTKKLLRREGKAAAPAGRAAGDNKTPAKAKPRKKAAAASVSVLAGQLGLVPLITEKGVRMQERATAAFRVRPDANKRDIARAIFEQYGVQPLAIRTMRMSGKRRRRGQTEGATARWKKAYVTVESIESLHLAA